MRLYFEGKAPVRVVTATTPRRTSRSLFSHGIAALLLLLAGIWSQHASAAQAYCELSAGSNPIAQTGTGNQSLTFGFEAVDGSFCNYAVGNVGIIADSTGGATITSGANFYLSGTSPIPGNFTVQLDRTKMP